MRAKPRRSLARAMMARRGTPAPGYTSQRSVPSPPCVPPPNRSGPGCARVPDRCTRWPPPGRARLRWPRRPALGPAQRPDRGLALDGIAQPQLLPGGAAADRYLRVAPVHRVGPHVPCRLRRTGRVPRIPLATALAHSKYSRLRARGYSAGPATSSPNRSRRSTSVVCVSSRVSCSSAAHSTAGSPAPTSASSTASTFLKPLRRRPCRCLRLGGLRTHHGASETRRT